MNIEWNLDLRTTVDLARLYTVRMINLRIFDHFEIEYSMNYKRNRNKLLNFIILLRMHPITCRNSMLNH